MSTRRTSPSRSPTAATGAVKSYTSEATTYADWDAFPADDSACALFADGFETGNTAGWAITEP